MHYILEQDEVIHSQNVISMYPHMMCAQYFPICIGEAVLYTRNGANAHEHNCITLDRLFGQKKFNVVPPKHLFHGVLPEKHPGSRKVAFPLTEVIGTCTSPKLQLAVRQGYVMTFYQSPT